MQIAPLDKSPLSGSTLNDFLAALQSRADGRWKNMTPISHYLPQTLRRLRKQLWRLVGKDDFFILNLETGTAERTYAEKDLPPKPTQPVSVVAGADTLVCLHIHYPELWPELSALLGDTIRKSDHDWDLVISLTPNAAELESPIKSDFPGARIFHFDNRGRDIGPFFELLRQGEFSKAKAVCKLHGKRSLTDRRSTELGEYWRRSTLRLLLDKSPSAVRALNSGFTAIGPRHTLMPSSRVSERSAWAGNEETLRTWGKKMGVTQPSILFFAGSMLWLSAATLEKLSQIGLTLENFPPESGDQFLDLAYAGERVFLIAAKACGGQIGTIDPDADAVTDAATQLKNS